MSDYELWYYRIDQAASLEQALADGAVRKHTLDGPAKNLLDGCAADAVALIAQAMYHFKQQGNIMEVQSCGGFIKDIQCASGITLGEFQ